MQNIRHFKERFQADTTNSRRPLNLCQKIQGFPDSLRKCLLRKTCLFAVVCDFKAHCDITVRILTDHWKHTLSLRICYQFSSRFIIFPKYIFIYLY